jgi:hypothetical protein
VLDSDERGPSLTAEQVPQPLRDMLEQLTAHADHPARAWFEQAGNGVFEDDHAASGLPAPHLMFRFRRDGRVAYVWQDGGEWFVRPWQRTRERVSHAVVRVDSLRAALDVLLPPPRPWWRFWAEVPPPCRRQLFLPLIRLVS